jgi:hypothetical protein
MNKQISNLINKILSESALDDRIESGIIDINNFVHREIIAEHLFDFGVDVATITSIVNTLAIMEGKYPDRQAYNKEGWLVTFPSPEYKDAAIKKGTHYANDPTHGRGGMNVYYKRKGKQKRMVKQDVSKVSSDQPSQEPSPQQSDSVDAVVPSTPKADSLPNTNQNSPAMDDANPPKTPPSAGNSELPPSGDDNDIGDPDKIPQSMRDFERGVTKSDNKQNNQPQTPEAEPSPTPPPAPSFVGISVKFAKSKNWSPTPFGEWRGIDGETSAIVALSGEVVPIKSNDREELKLLASKNITQDNVR